MLEIIFNNRYLQLEAQDLTDEEFHKEIELRTGLTRGEYYLTQNGKRLHPDQQTPSEGAPVRLVERLLGGKGGFGSMLRAIGAQIEKTTNREACRDLSGRRLRDINEEKRLKAYLEKQKEAPEDEAAKLQKKIDKLLAKPKHEFHDEEYNRTRSDLTQNVGEAVQEGFRKALEVEREGGAVKRKSEQEAKKGKKKAKKAKGALWLGDDDLGSSCSSSEDSDSESGSDSACSSGAGSSSTAAESTSAKQTVSSEEEEKSNQEKVSVEEPEVVPDKEVVPEKEVASA